MYVLPSTSSMRAPEARRMKSGEAPTALKARTGLSTPPGSTCCARANSVRDFDTFIETTCLSRSHEWHEGTRRTIWIRVLRDLRVFVIGRHCTYASARAASTA